MKNNDIYTLAAIICIVLVLGVYAYQFHSFSLSKDVDHWNQFGGYVGGILGPILSFLSLVMLIKSLNLQNESNAALKEESRLNIKNEKMRSFETHFFNLLSSQRESFEYFKLRLDGEVYTGVEAVRQLENCISEMRMQSATDDQIRRFIFDADFQEQLYNTQRVFYVIAKTVNRKLTCADGFSLEDRYDQIETMINFTEFSLLRVVLISMQFMNHKSSKLLRENEELLYVFNKLKLKLDGY